MLNKFLIIIFILLAIGVGFILFQQDKSQTPTESKQISKQRLLTALADKPLAPSFELPDDNGEMHSLSDYKGKPVILNFWATWCPPCRAELPSMNRGWDKIKDDGIEMIAVNVGEDEDTIFAFMGEHPINFQVLLDQSGDMVKQWPVRGLPTTFVIDKEGHIVYRAIGSREWDSDELLDVVRQLK